MPQAAPAPTPPPAVEACLPLQLSDEMKKQYASGQVCVRLQPKAPAATPAPTGPAPGSQKP
jgi:hypothetical protein